MDATLNFIGQIHSSLKNIDDCPLQENENSPSAMLEIFPPYMEGIKHIKEGAEILLLTWLHVADRTAIKCRPRNNKDGEYIGVFSTRSPDRPNPIGIHFVKVDSVTQDGFIKISGLEVLDQTPLVDIKPMWNISVRTT
ncbi:tRNA (N6-threonylcarbamoyladenosine(37)-N6)-methyltransferase TrmO [Danxiaibacter flavus]|uniref:tRNA (N6-threonylcarbamoyladenosine(37)-N6)-methyltransferase TrmO n=1 Tax=Danxiaibacter flavus TaxID=3049108 RepID=A0ABV3ZE68_9BACT|nr:tRNA (N6-threonylcarbamoyladenosine(37)-N6)-methyltransferase TrmO [Chitinophagaceae bacterium DXS]